MDTKLQEALAKAKKDLTADREFQQTSFNEAVGKGSLLGVGEHNLTITGTTVEVGNYGPQLVLIVTSDDGVSSKKWVSFQGEDLKTKKPIYNRGYTGLFSALLKDARLAFSYLDNAFLKATSGDFRMYDGLVGLKLRGVVVKAKQGVEVVESASGKFEVKDVIDGSRVIPKEFNNIQEALVTLKEEGYKQAYPKLSYFKPTKDLDTLALNEDVLRKIHSEVAGDV